MALTQFGIVYAIGSAQVRRFIYPTLSDAEIDSVPLNAGEAVTRCSRGPYVSTIAWQNAVNLAVTNAAGKAPGDPRCCVISASGSVVGVILADPAIDTVAGMTLVSSPQANIGWTWTSSGGFVSPPAVVLPKP